MADQAPFDRIVLTAAPPELPTTLIDQLKPGGKLLAPVGDQSAAQELTLVEKTAGGKITTRAVLPVRFVPMITLRRPLVTRNDRRSSSVRLYALPVPRTRTACFVGILKPS